MLKYKRVLYLILVIVILSALIFSGTQNILEGREGRQLYDHALKAYYSGDYTRAEALYRELIEKEPGNFENYRNLFALYGEQGRMDEAVRLYQRLLLHGKIPDAERDILIELGWAYYLTGNYKEAEKMLSMADEYKSLAGRIENHRMGLIYYRLEDYSQAADFFRKAVEKDPDFASAHLKLGKTLKAKGEIDAAVDSFNRTLTADSSFVKVHRILGALYYSLGDLDSAYQCLLRALLIREDPEMQKMLEEIEERYGIKIHRRSLEKAVRRLEKKRAQKIQAKDQDGQ